MFDGGVLINVIGQLKVSRNTFQDAILYYNLPNSMKMALLLPFLYPTD